MSETAPAGRRWPRARILALLLLIAVVGAVVAGWSGYHLYHRTMGPPRQTDVSRIAGWMTIDFIGHDYRVPPEHLYRALDIPPEPNRRRSLDELARVTGRSQAELLATVREVVSEHQRSQPTPPPRWPGGQSPLPRDRPPPPRGSR